MRSSELSIITIALTLLAGLAGAPAPALAAIEVCATDPALLEQEGAVLQKPSTWRAVMVLVNDRELAPGDLPSGTDVETELASIVTWFEEVSYGLFVFEWDLITPGDPSAPETSWFADEESALAAADAALDLCERDIVIWGLTSYHPFMWNAGGDYTGIADYPVDDPCEVAGLGEIHMFDYQIDGRFGYYTTRTHGLTHEIGHSLTLGHANFLSSYDGSSASTYGNHYGNMGAGYGYHFQSEFKEYLDWLRRREVIEANRDGTWTIVPLALPAAEAAGRPRMIKILKSEEVSDTYTRREYYTIDFRAAIPETLDAGLDGKFNLSDGVLVKLVTEGEYAGGSKHISSVLIDATPESPNAVAGTDTALTIGRTLHLPDPGLFITTTGVTADEATVEIRFDDGSENQPPASSGITIEILDELTGTLRLAANATDPDGDSLSYFWVVDTRGGDFEQGDYGWSESIIVVAGADPQPLPVSVLVSDRRGGMTWDRVNLFGHSNDSPEIDGGGAGFDFDGLQFSENVSDPEVDRLYFRWDLGDGQVSYVPTPKHTYEDADLGGFTVVMEVSDGEYDTGDTQQVYPNVAPVADAGPDKGYTLNQGQICVEVTVDGSASYDPDGTITDYYWLLDLAYIGNNPQQTLCLEEGTYTVTLIVIDDGYPTAGDRDEATIRVREFIVIKPEPPDPKPHEE